MNRQRLSSTNAHQAHFLQTLTELLKHLVTLVQNKVLDVLQVEGFVAHQREDSARRPDHDVRAALLQDVLVLLDGHATEEHGHLDRGHVLGEALVLLADLKSQLTRVTHDQHRHLHHRNTNGSELN